MIPGVSLPPGSRADSCGPAVLAAVMNYWKDPVTVGQLEAAVLRFDAKGMDTRDFLAVANRRGFVGRYERGSIGVIKEAVDEGAPPILVLPGRPGHALVAVGYNDRTQEVVFAETQGRLRVFSYDTLLPAWEGAGYFFILLRPGSAGELCVLGDRARDRRAWREAEAFYRMAIEREPGFAMSRAAMGDLFRLKAVVSKAEGARFGGEDLSRPEALLAEAEAFYREALRLDPASIRALNNLADLLVSRGGASPEAVALAERGVALAEAEWKRLWQDFEDAAAEDVRADLRDRLHRAMVEHLSALGTLGQARRAAGDAAGAVDAWKTGLLLAPADMREYRAYRYFEVATALGGDSRDEALRNLEAAAALTTDASLRRKIEEARRGLGGR